jgi:hypothetical protein
MLKLINHIIKQDKTRPRASLQVRQFTHNCAHQIGTTKITCILNNSKLFRIGDSEALSLLQFGQPCLLNPQVPTTISHVRASVLLSETLREREALLMQKRLPPEEGCPHLSWVYVAATRKNWWYQWFYCSCNFISYSKFQVVAGITPKRKNGNFNYQYKKLVKKRRGNWGYKINAEKNSTKNIKEEWKLYKSILRKYKYTSLKFALGSPCGLCIRGLPWARLPCPIGIGDKLSWGNLSIRSGRSRTLVVAPRVKFRFSNPVTVAISENKKEHSHRLWHRQI